MSNFESHYEYLNAVIESFWKKVFNKTLDEMWCNGIVSAHGDKVYQYKHKWEAAGVPFYRGALLFLLTDTKELGDTPKHMSGEWVIEKYPYYHQKIIEAESDVADLALESKYCEPDVGCEFD